MKNPTTRKIRNRGWTPIRYRTEDEVRHGWEVCRDSKRITVHLVGDDRPRRLLLTEDRYIEVLR